MTGLTNKLRCKKGASIVMAMVFFLICAVIGSIVLASAMSSAGRVQRQRAGHQAYLTVSSAARLVRGEISGVVLEDTDGGGLEPVSGENALTGMLTGAVAAVLGGGEPTSAQFTVAYGGDEVHVELSVYRQSDDALCAEAVFSFTAGDTVCRMVLTVPAAVTVRTESGYTREPESGGTALYRSDNTVTTVTFGYGTIATGGGL